MNKQNEQLLTRLFNLNLIQELPPSTGRSEPPWYLKALLAFTGWLAALFLLLSVVLGIGLEVILSNTVIILLIGMAFMGGALIMFFTITGDFFEHLALVLSLAGQVLTIFALVDIFEISPWSATVLLEIALIIIMPDFIHCVLSTLFAAIAMIFLLQYIFLCSIILFMAAWVWLNEFKFPKISKKMRAAGYGLILALISLKFFISIPQLLELLSYADNIIYSVSLYWSAEFITLAAALYVVLKLLKRHCIPFHGRGGILAIAVTLLLCAVSLKALGISYGIVIILLGFSASNRVLLGMGIISLLIYMSYYYYLLDTTLLVKAQILFITGIILLTGRWIMGCILSGREEIIDV